VTTAPGLFRRLVLRPPALYGPRDREFLPMFRLACAGWMPALGRSLTGVSLVDGRDAAAAAVALLETTPAEGVFFADDGARGYDFPAIARALAAATARRVRLVQLPLGPVRLLSRLLNRLPLGVPTALVPGRIRDLEQVGWVCDGSRLEQVTGYRCARRADRGFSETIAFNRKQGWQ
jgi:nucleoside-diphosphate-sugar epimerase